MNNDQTITNTNKKNNRNSEKVEEKTFKLKSEKSKKKIE